jgi:hypothetical protein
MAVLGQKKDNKKWAPVRKEKTAEQRKNEELYGRSVAKHGVGKKGDGSLMANGSDWKNLQQTHVNGVSAKQSNAVTSKDKKYENL